MTVQFGETGMLHVGWFIRPHWRRFWMWKPVNMKPYADEYRGVCYIWLAFVFQCKRYLGRRPV